MSGEMDVITLGVHVVDVLVRPVEEIPEGQGGQLVEEIRITAAGPAGGTAITLAKLGAAVQSAGAIGADELGEVLTGAARRGFGVDTSLLVRRDDVQTSASVLPIRPDGSRPAFHVVGANGDLLIAADAPWDAIAQATHLHLGAPEFMGGEEAAKILSFARETGRRHLRRHPRARVSRPPAIRDWLAPALRAPRLPAPQRRAGAWPDGSQRSRGRLRGAARARRRLRRGDVRCRRARSWSTTRASDAFRRSGSNVVDTTGCGDAFSAGFLRGCSLGRDLRDAAVLGCAAAALVAQGLGSDYGDVRSGRR